MPVTPTRPGLGVHACLCSAHVERCTPGVWFHTGSSLMRRWCLPRAVAVPLEIEACTAYLQLMCASNSCVPAASNSARRTPHWIGSPTCTCRRHRRGRASIHPPCPTVPPPPCTLHTLPTVPSPPCTLRTLPTLQPICHPLRPTYYVHPPTHRAHPASAPDGDPCK